MKGSLLYCFILSHSLRFGRKLGSRFISTEGKFHHMINNSSQSIYAGDNTLAQLLGIPLYLPEVEGRYSIIEKTIDANKQDVIQIRSSDDRQTPFYVDFSSPDFKRRRKECATELVCHAIANTDVVVDFTAGLGRDSILLASNGHFVQMFEKNPFICLLLQNALDRLKSERLSLKITLAQLDSSHQFNELSDSLIATIKRSGMANPRVSAYLDPLYPAGYVGGKSMVKKEMQIIHELCSYFKSDNSSGFESMSEKEQEQMFLNALTVTNFRVVVKRPLKGTFITNKVQPSGTIKGRSQRFDIYDSKIARKQLGMSDHYVNRNIYNSSTPTTTT